MVHVKLFQLFSKKFVFTTLHLAIDRLILTSNVIVLWHENYPVKFSVYMYLWHWMSVVWWTCSTLMQHYLYCLIFSIGLSS